MIVEGPRIHNDFRESTQGGKCEHHLGAVRKKKKIDLSAVGSRPNNILLEFLKCQNKVQAKDNNNNNNSNSSNGNSSSNGSSNNSRNNSNGNGSSDGITSCRAIEKSYGSCHASVMGTGNYNGKKHCGDELNEWLACCRAAIAVSAPTS